MDCPEGELFALTFVGSMEKRCCGVAEVVLRLLPGEGVDAVANPSWAKDKDSLSRCSLVACGVAEEFLLGVIVPGSRQNPKLLRIDDAEVVGDRIAKFWPASGDVFA